MPETRICPECGTQVPANSPAGLCPKCVMKLALESPSLEALTREPTQSSPQKPAGFVPPTPAELAGKFPQLDILELLGRGGMGAVYKARQRGLDRLVAIKILPPGVEHDAAFAERFTREARSLARLNHPNIVGVHDFGQTDGLYYFVMEFVDGVNLRQAIASGSMQAKDALAIVPQICDALQFAHNEGIVHRDIKPENILIDKKGRVKIADFGLAKLLGQEHSPDSLTATHQVMGTIRYMAPEQMEGSREIDHRADIYSLGVVFYEMLTGELPLGRFAPPSERVQIDIRLDEVVLRSLAKEPQRRYQQANDVKTDLDTISHSPPPAAPPKVTLPPKAAAELPSEPDLEEVRVQVRGPAIGLLVTGIIHCAFFPILLIVFLGYLVVEVRPAPQSSEIYEHFEAEPSGRSFERVTEPKPEGNHD
jgi:serine/threonine protein kinase